MLLLRVCAQQRLRIPVVVDEQYSLIAGRRRLEAYRQLAKEHGNARDRIPVRIVDLSGVPHGKVLLERDENTCRLPLQPSEYVALGNHSEKPAECRAIIEVMYIKGPRLELFARENNDGWACFGNELPQVLVTTKSKLA